MGYLSYIINLENYMNETDVRKYLEGDKTTKTFAIMS